MTTQAFTAEFNRLYAALLETTESKAVDDLLSEFCELIDSHPLMNCFEANYGNSYYEGVGELAELNIEMSNLLTNSYGVELNIKISASPDGAPITGYIRLVQMLDKRGFGSQNYRYLDDVEPEPVVVHELGDNINLETELLTNVCKRASDLVVDFVAEILGGSLAESIRAQVTKELAPNLEI